ncbi:thiosulfate dehydrogenase [quinone] large subunit [Gracilibacillus halotolerans]|uniref:Thiosulfate dehydrogenase [quinone] large subunit n=1 Tax=Gracilibacillus halotolerans TaxID=74386 RepID=A0A841RIA6_9BACI|nr:DoxX family protein [Gracilibacillus halotolerans]MBB6512209.1 thiosulfate dehydrogenase [quinone] large subunit [Gracilibacillus halotolerans]
MFNNLLRNNAIVAGVLAFIRIYLGYQWFTAGVGKVTGGFDATGFIQGAIAKAGGENPTVQGWWAAFLEAVALPGADLFTFLVAWGEVLVGIALILGLFTNFAALMGIIMNFAFLFSGTISTNGQMILLTTFILVAGFNAGKYGLDRFVLPYLKNRFFQKQTVEETVVKQPFEAH